MIEIGLMAAVASALVTSLSFLWKQKGAAESPAVTMRHPIKSTFGLFSSKWWTFGWILAVVAWLLHAGALTFAPLSLVQSVMAGGIVFVAVLATLCFGYKLGKREWGGISLTAVGLTLLGLTVHSASAGSKYHLAGLIIFESVAVVVGLGLLLSHRTDKMKHRQGIMLAVAAGLMFGVADISTKVLTGTVFHNFITILSPWTAVALIAAVVAFYSSARSLQVGEGLSVIATTAVTANLSAILGGILVFGDPLGHDVLTIAAKLVAFTLVIIAAALIPGHTRTGLAAQPA